jgi:hypothetical protein
MASINKKAAGIAAVGASAVAIGLAVASTAQADTSTPTPSPTSTTQSGGTTGPNGKTHGGPGKGGWGPGGKHLFGLGADLSELATKLGVSESKLEAAMKAVRPDLKDLPKPDTATSPDAFKDQVQKQLADALAKELGIDSAKVTKALDEIEAAHTADREKAFADHLAQAVKDGKLTQAEADAVQKAAKAGVIPFAGGDMKMDHLPR